MPKRKAKDLEDGIRSSRRVATRDEVIIPEKKAKTSKTAKKEVQKPTKDVPATNGEAGMKAKAVGV
jgi:hypothetical protein